MLLKSIPLRAVLGVLVVGANPASALPVATALNEAKSYFLDANRQFVAPLIHQESDRLDSSVAVSGLTGFAQAVIDPNRPSLTARAIANYVFSPDADAVAGAGASSTLDYYFALHQGATGAVPVRIDYFLSATRAYSASADAVITLDRYFGPDDDVLLKYDVANAGMNGGNETDTVVSDHFNAILNPGETFEIGLTADATAQVERGQSTPFDVTAQATADPRISIDPAYLASHPGVSIDISDGVGNIGPVAAVPEPSGWAMLLGGFALTGWYRVCRHRRRGDSTRRSPADLH